MTGTVAIGTDLSISSDCVKVVPEPESDTAVIAFANVGMRRGSFTFYRQLAGLPVHRIFVNDPAEVWYQRGVDGLGQTIDDSVESLRHIIDDLGARRVVTIGSSMGGYASLAFGLLLGAERAVAFGAETLLKQPGSRSAGFMGQSQVHSHGDLQTLMSRASASQIYLYAGEYEVSDMEQAMRLDGERVHRFSVRGCHHVVPLYLSERGGLDRLLRDACLDPDFRGNDFPCRGTLIDDPTSIALWAKGLALYRQKKPADAVDALEGLVERVPDNAMASGFYGVCLAAAGREAQALRYYDQAIDGGAANPIIVAELAKFLFWHGHPSAAEVFLRRAIAGCPTIARYQEELGHYFSRQGRSREALQSFEAALSLEPRNENYRRIVADHRAQLVPA